jgi:hypothetical protein
MLFHHKIFILFFKKNYPNNKILYTRHQFLPITLLVYWLKIVFYTLLVQKLHYYKQNYIFGTIPVWSLPARRNKYGDDLLCEAAAIITSDIILLAKSLYGVYWKDELNLVTTSCVRPPPPQYGEYRTTKLTICRRFIITLHHNQFFFKKWNMGF